MFHYVWQTDHRLVRVSLWLANRPSLATYWKFNTSLLEIQNFRKAFPSSGRGHSLAIDLARQDLEHEANECYKEYVVFWRG